MDSKALWLTPNTVSVYMGTWMELGDEPMVIETALRTFWDSSMMPGSSMW